MLVFNQKSVILQDFFKVDNNPQTRLDKRSGCRKAYE